MRYSRSKRPSTKIHRAAIVDQKEGTITYTGYIVLNGRGDMKLHRVPPALAPNEVSCFVTMTVPSKVFERPSLKAQITLPNNIGVADASANVVLDIKNALRACPGVEVHIGGK